MSNFIEIRRFISFQSSGLSRLFTLAKYSKHLFIPNFVGANLKCGYTKITMENKNLIESCYEARYVV